jgi:hypothetical protein
MRWREKAAPAEVRAAWEPAVIALLGTIGRRGFDDTLARGIMGNLCMIYLEDGSLGNLGEMQGYLRGRKADMSLFAVPFMASEMSKSDYCIDPVTREPRDHYLRVSVGAGEIAAQYALLGVSVEQNEAVLAESTGILFHAKHTEPRLS